MINIQKHIISEAFEQLSKSAKLKESKLTEAKIDKNKFNTGKYEYFVEIKYYEEEPDTFHVRANSISDLEDKLSNDDYIEWFDVLEDSNDYEEEADWEDTTDVKFDESKLKKPKYWNSIFTTKVIDAYNNKELTLKNIEEWETKYNGGKKPNPSLGTKEILDYYIKTKKDPRLDESKLTEAPMDVKDYAARLKARKAEKDQNPLEKINSQLNPDMTITDQLQVYFDELVPSSGKAKTVAGEIVRALMRLLYRDYNDGDLWYTGYGKETCGSEVIYLINELPDFAYDYFSRMAENAMEDAEYTDMLEELAEQAIVYLNENPQLFTQENIDDSRKHDYRKLSDIFSMPTYDYEPDVSYNPPEFNIDDEEIDQLIRDFVRGELSSGEVNRWARDGWTIVDLDKDDYNHAEEEFPIWFADFLEEHRREDEYDDDEDFDESLNKDNQKRGNDIMAKVAEDFELGNLEKMGTNEYEANKNRDKHIKMYRKFANISDSEPITEETINEYALNKTATYCNREPNRIKAEILGQRYSEYEQE